MSSTSEFPPKHLIPDPEEEEEERRKRQRQDSSSNPDYSSSKTQSQLSLPAPGDESKVDHQSGTTNQDGSLSMDHLGPMVVSIKFASLHESLEEMIAT